MAKNKSKKKSVKSSENKDKSLLTYIMAVSTCLVFIVALFKFGLVGITISRFFQFLVGEHYYLVCILGIIAAAIVIFDKKENEHRLKLLVALISTISAIVLWSAITSYDGISGFDVINNFLSDLPQYFASEVTISTKGGFFGALLYSLTSVLIAKEGTWILIGCLVILAILCTFTLSFFKDCFKSLKTMFNNITESIESDIEDEEAYEEEYEDNKVENIESIYKEESVINSFEKKKKKSIFMDVDDIGYGNSVEKKVETPIIEKTDGKSSAVETKKTTDTYRLPPHSLLESTKSKNRNSANDVAAKDKGEKLIKILENFGIKSELLATHIGPSVTKFELKPDISVKVSKINSISDNIKMELAAKDIRIEAPIPGRNAVGIEIPNVESTAVRMQSLINNIPSDLKMKKTLIALGKDLLGQPVYCDMHKMPHLLVAGATGSGKSVCMNTIITSILLRAKPSEVKLLLVDPKKVEFTPYQKIPHLIAPVISDATEASKALNVVVQIMEERYDAFSKAGVRNIDSFNNKVDEFSGSENTEKMPFIIVIVDELADLMAIAGKDVELSIQRITQLARAAGIHLIIATQRPSSDVITGIIKANVPSRIAFSVSSGIDSRVILDSVGAERLLGNGDMLYQPIGASSAIRLQGAYVSDDEVKNITDYCSNQANPYYNDKFLELDGVEGNAVTAIVKAEDDPLYQEVKDYVIEVQKASTSLIQRRFALGYNRAARMIDLLEDRGIIGEARGSKPREVYLKKEDIIE
ncbi:MAG: DNA translocase FtsK [Anaerorhabdus sp.]